MIGRRSEAAYFQFRQIIPKATIHMTAKTAEVASAVRRASPFSNARLLRCTFANERLTIAAENDATGKSTDSANLSYAGKEMEIGYDAKFMAEIFAEVLTPDVEMSLDKMTGPLIIRPIDSDLPFTAMHLVMPRLLS